MAVQRLRIPEPVRVARAWLSSHVLAGVLLLGLATGLASLLAVPPWWHYDEPGHFEYAWLAAHSPTWPIQGQYDQSMRKQMATSMLRYGWYVIRNYKPDLKSSEPIPIGVTQTGDQPGYYFLASLPLRLLSYADMTVQYYAARAVSLLLLLLIILAAWFALGEVLPADSPLRWMGTVFIATLPAFVDNMVSVNNDVGAVLAATLAIWACVRLIDKGYSMGRIAFLVISLAASYLSKSTAFFAFVLAPIAMLLAWLRGRHVLFVWAAAVVALVLVAALGLTGGAARAWYNTSGTATVRVEQQGAPLGSHVFRLDDSTPGASTQLLQILTPDDLESLKGKPATFGLSVWASQPTDAGPFYVEFTTRRSTVVGTTDQVLPVSSQPTQYRLSLDVPNDVVSGTIYLKQTSHGLASNAVFLDEIILTPGRFATLPQAPVFADASGTRGTWDGNPFTNLVRNPSAEAGALQIRRSIDVKTAGVLSRAGISLSATLAMLQDWSGSSWYYRNVADTVFRTFWISLAGDKAVIRSSAITIFLVLLTVAGVLGALVRLWRRRRSQRWDLVGFLAIAMLLPWFFTLIRGSGDVLRGNVLFPWARYAFPAIVPTALMLCAGWLEWLERLAPRFGLVPAVRNAIFFAVMLGISLLAIFNAVRIFHPAWWLAGVFPAVVVLLVAAAFYLYLGSASHIEAPPSAQPSSAH